MVRTATALACAVLMFTAGSFVAPHAVRADNYATVAPGAPPDVPYEPVPPTPGPQYVWVPGHWQYAYNRWIWIGGEWQLAPYAGAVWVPGRWARRAYGWVWISGHWRGAAGYPGYAPAYPAGEVFVAGPPPQPRVEVIGAPPFVGAIWIGGFWRWNGGGWGWVPGHWGRAPWRGAVWVPGHWNRGPRGWIWVGGFWR